MGAKMDAWAHRWVTFETDGVAKLGTTAMNDTGAMLALQALTAEGKANWDKAVLLRTASNFDMPEPGGDSGGESGEREAWGLHGLSAFAGGGLPGGDTGWWRSG